MSIDIKYEGLLVLEFMPLVELQTSFTSTEISFVQ